jgi:hypothetical protein
MGPILLSLSLAAATPVAQPLTSPRRIAPVARARIISGVRIGLANRQRHPDAAVIHAAVVQRGLIEFR